MGQYALRLKGSLPLPRPDTLFWCAPELSIGYATIQNPGEKLAISVYADHIFSTGINCSYCPMQLSGLSAKQVN